MDSEYVELPYDAAPDYIKEIRLRLQRQDDCIELLQSQLRSLRGWRKLHISHHLSLQP